MDVARRLGTLALLLAVLASAAPLAADPCGGAARCPMMRLTSAAAHASEETQLLPVMDCCRPAPEPASAPVATAVPAPTLAAPASDLEPAAVAAVEVAPPALAAALAERALAEHRHALGVFLLDSVFRL